MNPNQNVALIRIPQGVPPVILEAPEEGIPSDEAIVAWGKECRKKHSDGFLMKTALQYWVRYTYPSYSENYRLVGERIDALFKG